MYDIKGYGLGIIFIVPLLQSFEWTFSLNNLHTQTTHATGNNDKDGR